LYESRWNIEVFFKWIKQHLRIKSFFGYSENAVKTQIWTAVCTYVLVAIAKKQLGIRGNLYTFFQVVGMTVIEKTPIFLVFSDSSLQSTDTPDPNQLILFDI